MLTRDLQPSERGLLRTHLLRLSPEDRVARFSGGRSEHSITAYVDAVDFTRDHIKVAFDTDLNVIAAAHLVITGDCTAEFALSIEATYRNQGHGRDLFKAAVRWMQNRGIRKAYSTCMRSNGAMMHIAVSEGMQLHFEGAEVDAFLDLDSANFGEFWQEMIEEQHAWLDFTGKLLASPHAFDYLSQPPKKGA